MLRLIILIMFVIPLGVALHGFSLNTLIFISMLLGIPFCKNLVIEHSV